MQVSLTHQEVKEHFPKEYQEFLKYLESKGVELIDKKIRGEIYCGPSIRDIQGMTGDEHLKMISDPNYEEKLEQEYQERLRYENLPTREKVLENLKSYEYAVLVIKHGRRSKDMGNIGFPEILIDKLCIDLEECEKENAELDNMTEDELLQQLYGDSGFVGISFGPNGIDFTGQMFGNVPSPKNKK